MFNQILIGYDLDFAMCGSEKFKLNNIESSKVIKHNKF